MEKEYNNIWTMKDEFTFIDGIGIPLGETKSNRQGGSTHMYLDLNRRQLLKKYLDFCYKRVRWDGVQKDMVIEYTLKSLQMC